jgi:glycosyltransferase involved in cell wall biosynthesis
MRILLTTDTVGGVWTYAFDLSRALRAHGIDVALATMGAPVRPDQRRQLEPLDNVRLFESTFKLEWMNDPWDDVRRAREWLLGIEDEFRPDVVHLNGYAHGALPWRSPVLVAGHSCVLSWWQAVKGEPAPPAWDRYWHEVRRGLHAADLVVTAAMLRELQRLYGPLAEAAVIPNGRDARHFRRDAKEPFVLAAGRLWDEAKNLAALDHATPHLDWPVYVAGDDRAPGGEQGVSAWHVRPLGRLDETSLAKWLGRAAIYALPAKYEPFGLSALEAALCGCALVLGDIESLREVWGDAAVFVPPGDADALRRELIHLIRNPRRRVDLGGRAHRRAGRYTTRAMADAYADAYRRLLDARRGDEPASAVDETPQAVSAT